MAGQQSQSASYESSDKSAASVDVSHQQVGGNVFAGQSSGIPDFVRSRLGGSSVSAEPNGLGVFGAAALFCAVVFLGARYVK